MRRFTAIIAQVFLTSLVAFAILLTCWQRLSIKLDPQEPPLLKPKVPYIGHIIGIIQHNIAYFDILL